MLTLGIFIFNKVVLVYFVVKLCYMISLVVLSSQGKDWSWDGGQLWGQPALGSNLGSTIPLLYELVDK